MAASRCLAKYSITETSGFPPRVVAHDRPLVLPSHRELFDRFAWQAFRASYREDNAYGLQLLLEILKALTGRRQFGNFPDTLDILQIH